MNNRTVLIIIVLLVVVFLLAAYWLANNAPKKSNGGGFYVRTWARPKQKFSNTYSSDINHNLIGNTINYGESQVVKPASYADDLRSIARQN